MRKLSTTSQIIDALGGTGVLAGKLGISKPTVSGWRQHGETIPSKYKDVMFRMLASLPEPCSAPASLWGMAEMKSPGRTEAV